MNVIIILHACYCGFFWSKARVSNDYHPGSDMWKIGITSMFADALGIAPYKDNFWTTEIQPDSPYGKVDTCILCQQIYQNSIDSLFYIYTLSNR